MGIPFRLKFIIIQSEHHTGPFASSGCHPDPRLLRIRQQKVRAYSLSRRMPRTIVPPWMLRDGFMRGGKKAKGVEVIHENANGVIGVRMALKVPTSLEELPATMQIWTAKVSLPTSYLWQTTASNFRTIVLGKLILQTTAISLAEEACCRS